LVEGKFSTQSEIAAGVPQCSVLPPILYSLHINDGSATPGTHLALFADATCIYSAEKHKRHVLCKLQCGLTAVKSWYECWNMKINEEKFQAISFSRRRRVPDDVLQLNGRDISLVNNVTYLGVTFDRRMTWRHDIERTVAKVLRTYLRTYCLLKSERVSPNIKLTLYKALIRSVMIYVCPTREYAADSHLLKLQRMQNRVVRAIGNLDRRTTICELHLVSKLLTCTTT
jgi:hypothetical protein